MATTLKVRERTKNAVVASRDGAKTHGATRGPKSNKCPTCGQQADPKRIALEKLKKKYFRDGVNEASPHVMGEVYAMATVELTHMHALMMERERGRMMAPLYPQYYMRQFNARDFLTEAKERAFREGIAQALREIVDARTAENIANHPDAPFILRKVAAIVDRNRSPRDPERAGRILEHADRLRSQGTNPRSIAAVVAKAEGVTPAHVRQVLGKRK